MQVNYPSQTNIAATMTVDGITYDSVGVRFKGQTSYSQVTTQKKSFNIETDWIHPDQDIMGYNIMNLNNCFQDPSFMHEVVYQQLIRKHIPSAKSAYTNLYINGATWGLYPHVQQLNKDFLEEWFLSNDGTNWRADKPPGSGGPGGGWGDGTAALNYLGTDTSLYKQYYTLKTTNKTNPWDDLRDVCLVLDTVSTANMEAFLADYLDIDRALWHVGSEILFCDDDSYVYKGKMDYYVYWEAETDRCTPLEYDGNSAFETPFVTSWSPFYHETNVNYPLLNRMLAVPAIRQRYLAHFRTLINDELDTAQANQIVDNFNSMIDPLVQADPKKIYTYSQYLNEKQAVKNFVSNRRNYLLSNAEVNRPVPSLSNYAYYSNGIQWNQPDPMQAVDVSVQVSSTNGIDHVYAYYDDGLVGKFARTLMYDDGLHNDSLSADGIYGATIPGFAGGTWVRYYFEAAAADAYKTVSFYPAGAEHNVFVYQVKPALAASIEVVINEMMASNATTAADNAGEFDDWIELYNLTTQTVDLSGYTITDNPLNLVKWQIPAGTTIAPNDYLIIWADEDASQGPLHASFKLSSTGERIMLLNANMELVDDVTFGQQTTDMGFARVPNGTGSFVIQAPTFAANNNLASSIDDVDAISMTLYPNPAKDEVMLTISDREQHPVEIINMLGAPVYNSSFSNTLSIHTGEWPNGIYVVRCGNKTLRLVVRH
jgi:hypothetical protein